MNQQQKAFICQRCQGHYSENNPPRRINCSKRHSVCQQCLQKALNSPAALECPVDKEIIQLGQKNLDDFPRNLEVLNCLEEIAKRTGKQCQEHKAEINYVCITCRTEICPGCRRKGHKGHTTKDLPTFNEKVSEKKFPTIAARVAEIKECQNNKEVICSEFQEIQCQQIDAKVNELCAILIAKGEKLKEEVLQKTHISLQNDQNSENVNILNLKKHSQKLLLDLEKSDEKNIREIVFALYEEKNIYENLDIDGWKKEQENQVENLKMLLSQYQINFNQNLKNLIDTESFGEFSSPSFSPPPGKIDDDSYQETSSIFDEELSRARRLLDLFGNSSNFTIERNNEIIVLETTDYIYNDFSSQEMRDILSKPKNQRIAQDALSHINGIFLRCSNFSDKSIGHMKDLFDSMENLNSIVLSFKDCGNLTLQGIEKLCYSVHCYNILNDLKIDFSGRENFSKEDLKILLRSLDSFPHLETLYLELSGCLKMTDHTLKEMLKSFRKFKNLQNLGIFLRECSKMTDEFQEGAFKYLKKFPDLKSFLLDLRSCKRITNQSTLICQQLPSLDFRIIID